MSAKPFSISGTPCQYAHNGVLYDAILTGLAHLDNGWLEFEIRIVKAPRSEYSPLRSPGAHLWVFGSSIDAPGFWKQTKTGAIRSQKVSRVENATWRNEKMFS